MKTTVINSVNSIFQSRIIPFLSGEGYDDYLQEKLPERILETVNCSIPFIAPKYRTKSKICKDKLLGKMGIEIYKSSPIELTNLWSGESFIQPPCKYHQFETRDRGSKKGENASFHSGLRLYNWIGGKRVLFLNINSKMRVTEQFWAFTFLDFVAETGGFVGLFLGFSILDLRIVFELCCRKLSLYKISPL